MKVNKMLRCSKQTTLKIKLQINSIFLLQQVDEDLDEDFSRNPY